MMELPVLQQHYQTLYYDGTTGTSNSITSNCTMMELLVLHQHYRHLCYDGTAGTPTTLPAPVL